MFGREKEPKEFILNLDIGNGKHKLIYLLVYRPIYFDIFLKVLEKSPDKVGRMVKNPDGDLSVYMQMNLLFPKRADKAKRKKVFAFKSKEDLEWFYKLISTLMNKKATFTIGEDTYIDYDADNDPNNDNLAT